MNKYQPDVIMLDYVLTGNWVHKHDLKERVGDLINHVGKVVLLVRDQSRSEAARDALKLHHPRHGNPRHLQTHPSQ